MLNLCCIKRQTAFEKYTVMAESFGSPEKYPDIEFPYKNYCKYTCFVTNVFLFLCLYWNNTKNRENKNLNVYNFRQKIKNKTLKLGQTKLLTPFTYFIFISHHLEQITENNWPHHYHQATCTSQQKLWTTLLLQTSPGLIFEEGTFSHQRFKISPQMFNGI